MGRFCTLTLLICVAAAPAPGQGFDSNLGASSRPLSNRPVNLSGEWPPTGPSQPADASQLSSSLRDPVTTAPAQNQFSHQGITPDLERKTPIRRTGQSVGDESTSEQGHKKPKAAEMLRTGAWNSGIAVILLATFGVAAVMLVKKRHPQLAAGLPREVCDVLGRKRIDPRTSVCLVRLGSRILVLGSTAETVTPLAEITDPVEIDQIAGLCKVSESGLPSFSGLLNKRIKSESQSRTAPRRERSPDRSKEPADLPGLRGLKRGQNIDLTTP